MRRFAMFTLAVLPWILATMFAVVAGFGFVELRRQGRAIHGMAQVVVRMGVIAADQERRIDGIDNKLPGIYKRDADLDSRIKVLESQPKPQQYFFGDPMPNPFPTNNYLWPFTNGFGTNMFFYVSTPCSGK